MFHYRQIIDCTSYNPVYLMFLINYKLQYVTLLLLSFFISFHRKFIFFYKRTFFLLQ